MSCFLRAILQVVPMLASDQDVDAPHAIPAQRELAMLPGLTH
jgi:hypothetical protein